MKIYILKKVSVSFAHVENCGGLFETAFAFVIDYLNYFSKSRLEKLTK